MGADIPDVLPITCHRLLWLFSDKHVSVHRQMGQNLITPGGARIIETNGKYVMPGNMFALVIVLEVRCALIAWRICCIRMFDEASKILTKIL